MHACFEPLYVCGCIYVEECGQAREGENVSETEVKTEIIFMYLIYLF